MYKNQLISEGIAETRIDSIIKALDNLHTALVELDGKNLEIFLSKNIMDRINEFAKSEGLATINSAAIISKYYENQKIFEKIIETK
ncbi:MAG: hypothetical protein CVV49_13825 [Spirochaetae bacterium HGW-Spirochaetae-5]|nr:MAG: hypothetical protein CVV49_13825 [Spirochaetae bacterium HGW-Spirochaetae-5]